MSHDIFASQDYDGDNASTETISEVEAIVAEFEADPNGAVLDNFSPREGCCYTLVRAISARINQNFDAWPSDELRIAHHTFVGKPVFVNHNNHDPSRARGRVVASRYVDAGEDDRYVQVLQEVEASRFPMLAKELMEGGLDSVSMGAEAREVECSYCGNISTSPFDACEHIPMKGATLQRRTANGSPENVLIYEICRKISFFELSYVFDPADETAVASNVLVANRKTADQWDDAVASAVAGGGFTFRNAPGDGPTSGYMVSTNPESERPVPTSQVTPELVRDYIDEFSGALGSPNKYIGGWDDKGTFYLDISTHVQDREEAEELARANNQLAIWDVAAEREIRTARRQALNDIEVPPKVDTLHPDDDEKSNDDWHEYVDNPNVIDTIDVLDEPDLGLNQELERPEDEVPEGFEEFEGIDEEIEENERAEEELAQDSREKAKQKEEEEAAAAQEQFEQQQVDPNDPNAKDPEDEDNWEKEEDGTGGTTQRFKGAVEAMVANDYGSINMWVEKNGSLIASDTYPTEAEAKAAAIAVAKQHRAEWAGYSDFDQCTEDNSDKDDPDAYCGEIKNRADKESKMSRTARRKVAASDLYDEFEAWANGLGEDPSDPLIKQEYADMEGVSVEDLKAPDGIPSRPDLHNRDSRRKQATYEEFRTLLRDYGATDDVDTATVPELMATFDTLIDLFEEMGEDAQELKDGLADLKFDSGYPYGAQASRKQADRFEQFSEWCEEQEYDEDSPHALETFANEQGLSDAEVDALQKDVRDVYGSRTSRRHNGSRRTSRTNDRDNSQRSNRMAPQRRRRTAGENKQTPLLEDTGIAQTPGEEAPVDVDLGDGSDAANNSESDRVKSARRALALELAREKAAKRAARRKRAEAVGADESGDNVDREDLFEDFPATTMTARLRKRFAAWVQSNYGCDLREASGPGELRTWARNFSRQADIDLASIHSAIKRDVQALRLAAEDDDEDEGVSGGEADSDDIPDFIEDKIEDDEDDKKESSRRRRPTSRRRVAGDVPESFKENWDDEGSDDSDDDKKESAAKRRAALRRRAAQQASRRGRTKTTRRRTADDKLDLAAPDERVNVEKPTSGTTDADAEASQFDKADFDNNSGKGLENPDTTPASGIPGGPSVNDLKRSSARASGLQAVQLAEAMIAVGLLEDSSEAKFKAAAEFEKMARATVLDRTALLGKVAKVQTARRSTSSKTAGNRGTSLNSAVPPNMTRGTRSAAPQQREASSANDSDLFL